MKIIQLTAENVKRLVAVSITPDGHLIVIGGPNGAGKTSVLDSIMYALAGKKSLPAVPLRNGAKKAKVEVVLEGDPSLIVTRTFTAAGGSVLTVTSPKGAAYSSPQAMLDALCGRIAFDPLEFTRLRPKDQADMLRELVGLNFAELDARRTKLFANRTVVNREVCSLNARAEAASVYPDAPEEEVSVSDLVAELTLRQKVNADNEIQRGELRQVEGKSGNVAAEFRQSARRLEVVREQLKEAEADWQACVEREVQHKTKLSEQQAVVGALVDMEVDDLHEQIDQAEATNHKVRSNAQRAEYAKQAIDKNQESDGLTEAIDEIDADKAAQLAEATWPVPGLGFNDDGVTLNDLPFDQASSAEALGVSVAMGFAMNPTLRVLLIRNGSLLDADSLALVAKQAAENDGQVFIERVGEGDECSVIIEDGHVKAT